MGAQRDGYDDGYEDEYEGYDDEGYAIGGDGNQMRTQGGFAYAQRQPPDYVQQEFARPQQHIPQQQMPQQRQPFQRQTP